MDIISLHKMCYRAMENWGCITVIGKVYLTDPNATSAMLI